MAIFQLETILPTEGLGAGRSGADPKVLEKERNAAYASGFKDGVNVTKDALDVEKSRVLSCLNEALSDFKITREQAGATVMRSMSPLLRSLVENLAPKLLHDRLIEQVHEALATILRDLSSGVVVLEVAPELAPLALQVCEENSFDIDVEENTDMHGLEVVIRWADGYDHFDVSETRDRILQEIERFEESLKEVSDERKRQSG